MAEPRALDDPVSDCADRPAHVATDSRQALHVVRDAETLCGLGVGASPCLHFAILIDEVKPLVRSNLARATLPFCLPATATVGMLRERAAHASCALRRGRVVPLHASFEGACRELDDDAALLIDYGVGNATDVWEGHPGGSAHSRWVEHPFGCLSTRYYGPNCAPEDRPTGPGSSAVPHAVSIHRDDFDDEGAPCPPLRARSRRLAALPLRGRAAPRPSRPVASPPDIAPVAACARRLLRGVA